MRKLMMLMVAVLLMTGCEGDRGPTGPAGTDGNANVLTGTISPTSADWLWNSWYTLQTTPNSSTSYFTRYVNIPVAEITPDFLSTGTVLVFFESQPGSGAWKALPFHFAAGYSGYSYNYVYEVRESEVRLHFFFMYTDGEVPAQDLSTFEIPTLNFKYMVIEGTALQAALDKGVDLADHDEMADYATVR